MLARSEASALPDNTLRGRDSRLPPHVEPGARARTEASVSMLRRRRFEDEARVTTLASSVRSGDWWPSLPAVRCRGMADAAPVRLDGAGETGYWWLNITAGWDCWLCEFEPLGCCKVFAGEVDCMVVNVVVSDWLLWLGELNVLPLPAPSMLLRAPPVVVFVKALLWPVSLCTVSGIVATVGALLLLLGCGSLSCCPAEMTLLPSSFRGCAGVANDN